MNNQDVATPRAFLDAVEERFGKIAFDLAASETNHACEWWYGPGSTLDSDSMKLSWTLEPSEKPWPLQWLNPPYSDKANPIGKWAEKCALERARGCKIALLVPASVCTGWFIEHVAPHAYVFELTPRVFKTEIRDCILALYTPEGYVGRETWKWR